MINRSLRQYQTDSNNGARSMVGKGFRCVLIQGVTGTGKTRQTGDIINNAITKFAPNQNHLPESERKKQTVWYIVPRKELLWQASSEFQEWKIRHGMISAKSKESAAFQVHIVSRDTLIRRIKASKIRNWPDIIIMDECHLALDQQLLIKEKAPPATIFLGFTATPQRLDGRPLLGMWDVMIEGKQLSWFVEHKFLKHPWVMSVPPQNRLKGLAQLKTSGQKGDVNAKDLMELYKARAQGKAVMYGDEIEHYRKHGMGRSFLCFCRTVAQAEEVAEEFRNSGFPVECIEGTMSDKVRKGKIDRVKSGRLVGLTNADLCTYGLDVPKISCIILLRLTKSVALFFQMIGRGERWDGEHKRLLILDHVGNCDDKNHGHPLVPRIWNFEGNIKKEKIPKDAIEPIDGADKCPICYDLIIEMKECAECKSVYSMEDHFCHECSNKLYKVVMACRTCGGKKLVKSSQPLKQVNGWLVEINEPTPMKERPIENQRHYHDMINSNVDRFRDAWYGVDGVDGGKIDSESISNLITAGTDLAWKNLPMQVYWRCAKNEDLTVNVSLLKEIAELKEYNPYWITRKREDIEVSLRDKRLKQEQEDAFYDNHMAG